MNTGPHPYCTRIIVTVGGVGGIDSATFPLDEWNAMSAAARVLALHERLPHATGGRTFDIMAERRAP